METTGYKNFYPKSVCGRGYKPRHRLPKIDTKPDQ